MHLNLNQIRIVEACHKFLIGITSFEEELQDDTLVYQYQGERITFDTYQEYEHLSFVDYKLKFGYLDDVRTYLDDREELVNAFPTEEHLRALQRVSNPEQARIQIFKLLTEVNLETLTNKNPEIKRDNFGYSFFNFATKEEYPIYLFSNDATFELVAIS
ncbi:hypothetical protein HO670_07825 [Streptococcus suis]|uniref:Uncharacterized protein n=1 Tax=Streptococcus suis TaxID=1307 RepID=A0A116MH92_STRSU|nr:hypothetical protein [Streptococcus suis]NQG59696.1 hypothetical protein [Streptococcus suis]NQH17929.1 hypothetical protein [Streptococcus suis]CYV47612.1 Uncharacterised protein [Streptococcus suis]CYW05071.1 Uncharacterised protein [Streptococcus suis]HEM5038220.1 hypothetical protein [Streptococcus suis]